MTDEDNSDSSNESTEEQLARNNARMFTTSDSDPRENNNDSDTNSDAGDNGESDSGSSSTDGSDESKSS